MSTSLYSRGTVSLSFSINSYSLELYSNRRGNPLNNCTLLLNKSTQTWKNLCKTVQTIRAKQYFYS